MVGCYSSTTLYCQVLQYYSSTSAVLQSTAPVLLQYYKILQRSTPVLLCTTKYYNVLLQYCSVLPSTTPVYDSVLQSTSAVLLRTTTYYSSTTPYYKVLLRTTKYYSSTTPYYKVLLQYYSVLIKYQYYSVLQSTTPVLLCTDSNAVRSCIVT